MMPKQRFLSGWGKRLGLMLLFIAVAIGVSMHSSLPELGRAATSPLAQADQRIQQLRMGNVVVRVVDPQNQPIANATVQLNQTAHSFEFGTALASKMFAANVKPAEQTQYLQLAKQFFNATVHEDALKWYSTEFEQGQINYADADRILAWSRQNGMKMRGHTLFWEVEKWQKPWVKKLSTTKLRSAVQQRTLDVCQRYRGQISEYDVLNEMLHGNFFRGRLGNSIVKQIFDWCKQVDPNVVLYVNDFNTLTGKMLTPYVDQIRTLLKQGVPIGGIGEQAHIRETITPEQVQRSLETLAQFKLPIKLTELDVVAATEADQARVLTEIMRVAFAHPAVQGIYHWGFWAGAMWEPKAALFRQNFQPKPAAIAYQKLVYQDWWTKTKGTTNSQGQWQSRAFFGQYEAIAIRNGKTIRTTFQFPPVEKQPKVITLVLP
jgi:endo-1,4-beta-xylanase